MKQPSPKLINRHLILFCIIFIVLLPYGSGGLEGDQRELIPSERHDNWNFIVPFFYGQWPNLFGSWRISLTIFQIFILWLGFYLIFKKFRFDSLSSSAFLILFYISTYFSANLYRDASLFAIATLGIGMLFESSRQANKKKYIYTLLGIFFFLIASMFKPFYSLILGLVFLNASSVTSLVTLKSIIKRISIFILIILFSFGLNNIFSEAYNLKKVYPEQQPIIMDLSAQYCWGTNSLQIKNAGNTLSKLVKENYPLRSMCSSLRPDSWDNLHNYPETWEYSSPIIRITGNNDEMISSLILSWLKLILTHPVDWLQVRLYFLGPTLFASNSFTSNFVVQNIDNASISFFSKIWNFSLLPILILDKMRISSLGCSLLFILWLYIRNTNYKTEKSKSYFESKQTLNFSLITIISTVILGTLVSVANNGRYFLPYILLTYIILIRSNCMNSKNL
jgi:hypothetical protein